MRLALVLWLFAATAYGQRVTSDIVIQAPATVAPGSFTIVTVTGLDAAEIAKAQIGLVPPDPKILSLRLPTTDGVAFLLAVFADAPPGERIFKVSLNPWREHMDAAAATVAFIDEGDIKRVKELAAELGTRYTYKFGSAVLEVTGPRPPPPLPVPPTPPDGIASQLIILRDQTTATTKSVSLLLDLQEKYQRGTKPEMFLMDRTDPSALTKLYLARKPAAAAYPYYFLIAPGGVLLDHGELPPTLEQAEAIIAKFQEKK